MLRKLNQYFFDDGIKVSEMIFYYGLSILGLTICIFALIGAATL